MKSEYQGLTNGLNRAFVGSKLANKNTVLSEESEVESNTIKGHRLNNIYNPIFEPTLTPEQIDMIDEVCKPFIIQNHKSDIDDAVLYVSSANRKEVTK